MTVDATATSSPEPFPEPAPGARLTQLRDALKQLRSQSPASVPLASLAPSAAAIADPAPIEPARPPREEAIAGEAVAASPQVLPDANIKEAPAIAAAEIEPAWPPFCIESWFSAGELRQYRQLAGAIASQLPSDEPAAFAVATISGRHDAATIAAGIALCLTERKEGEVLLVERGGPGSRLLQEPRRPTLLDVVSRGGQLNDAMAPAALPGLHVGEFGDASPHEAPANDRWRTAIDEVKRRFRYVVSGVRFGEDSSLDGWLAMLDGIYLAVALGETPSRIVAARQAELHANGVRILGCIALA